MTCALSMAGHTQSFIPVCRNTTGASKWLLPPHSISFDNHCFVISCCSYADFHLPLVTEDHVVTMLHPSLHQQYNQHLHDLILEGNSVPWSPTRGHSDRSLDQLSTSSTCSLLEPAPVTTQRQPHSQFCTQCTLSMNQWETSVGYVAVVG